MVVQFTLLNIVYECKRQAGYKDYSHRNLEGVSRYIAPNGKPCQDSCRYSPPGAGYDMPVHHTPVACHREEVGDDYNRLGVAQGSHRTQGCEHSGDGDHVDRADAGALHSHREAVDSQDYQLCQGQFKHNPRL